MYHIVGRFRESGIPDPFQSFRNVFGAGSLRLVFLSDNAEERNGDLVIGGPGQGRVYEHDSKDQVFLGSNVTTATILHELGHAFERRFDNPLRDELNGLRMSASKQQMVGLTSDFDIPLPSDISNVVQSGFGGDTGLLARANSDADPAEVWADMFMNWVLDKVVIALSEDWFEIAGSRPGWACGSELASSQANFKFAFTELAVHELLQSGSLPGDFIEQINLKVWPTNGISNLNLPCR